MRQRKEDQREEASKRLVRWSGREKDPMDKTVPVVQLRSELRWPLPELDYEPCWKTGHDTKAKSREAPTWRERAKTCTCYEVANVRFFCKKRIARESGKQVKNRNKTFWVFILAFIHTQFHEVMKKHNLSCANPVVKV